ncbi:DUF4384 domain-containing protein [bacterium]|nr:DUF4384 domain-containing protein [bacterium]
MSLTDTPGPAWSGYGAGLILSLAAHAGAAALMLALLNPSPVADQPPPKSEIHIETQSVAQSQAKPQAAGGEEARTAPATGASAAQGTVRQSQAEPAALPQTMAKVSAPTVTALNEAAPPPVTAAEAPQATALAETPPPPALAAAVPPATPLTAAEPPPAATLAQSPPPSLTPAATLPATVLAQTTAPTDAVVATPPPAESLAAAAPPPPVAASALPSQSVTASEAAAPPVAAVEPAGQVAASATPRTQSLVPAPVTGDQVTATLAWAGEGGAIDPVSLKAIASFMRPGDAAAQADDVHDGLAAILSSAPCSRLQAEFNPQTGSLDLRGHVPDPAMKGPILAALQAQLGAGIKVEDAMVILPRPQCGALSGIADLGLPQSQDQLTNPRLIGADAQARTFNYVAGQTMVLDLAAPDYDAYVYVDYFDADGNVIHLVPNDQVPLKRRAAKSAMRVGAPDAGEPFLHLTIGPPYGQEIAAAFAASAPLYDGTRPLTEPAGPYLEWLKTRVAAARARDPDFKGEWVYFMVSTKEK